ncbi:MAG: response regulator [Acidobacteria bacterium]|nr:response regulator [Acidobacteriota bacterium]
MEEVLHILLIEDSAADAFLLQESLTQVDHPPKVIHVERLAEAQEYLGGHRIDAILLDLALPDSEGLTTLERTNTVADYLPIIVLTGLEDEAVAIEAVRKGAQDYLLKGRTAARQLMQTIHRAIERKRMERALAQSAQRNRLLVQVSAEVVAQTELEGLLATVAEASRVLTSAHFACAGAGYEKDGFRFQRYSFDESVDPETFREGCRKKGAYLDLTRRHVTIRLSNEELRLEGAQWGLPQSCSTLKGFMGARLIDVHGQAAGSIIVGDREGNDAFTEEDESLLRQLALITSLALQHIESRTAAEAASIAKSQFLANMSHELRTPMNAILGMTDLALNEDLPPMVRDYLQTARESADLLLEFLNEILDLSRIEAGRFDLESTVFSLHKTVEQVVKTLRVRAREKGLALICSMPSHVPDLLIGDPLRFRQILMNLVDNAIKFTHAGSIVVKVELRNKAADAAVLEFSVSDTGVGISPEDQERIFLAFTQADASTTRNYGGSGLGLTIARKLVELMNGRIWVESRPNQGSTFHFTLCLKIPQETPTVDSSTAKSPSYAVARRALRVLLAEDTPTNQKLAEYLLKKRGHIVEIARDGQQALEFVQQHDYDVILMDVQMPIMDGFQTTAAIRGLDDPAKAGLPIIAMTAHALKEDAKRCLDAGMDAYVSKPIQAEEFIGLVELLGESGENAEDQLIDAGMEAAGIRILDGDCHQSTDERQIISADNAAAFDLKIGVGKCFGKYDFFLDMVDGFFDEADDAIRSLQKARLQAGTEEVRTVAHRLKNTIVYLGAKPAADAIVDVESAAGSGDMPALDRALVQLGQRLEELKNALIPYRRKESPATNEHE